MRPVHPSRVFGQSAALSLLLAAGLHAEDTPKLTPLDEFRAAQKETIAAMQEFTRNSRLAKTEEDRGNAAAIRAEKLKASSARLLEVAEKHPSESFAVEALASVVMNDFAGENSSKALAALARDHAASDRVASLLALLPHSTSPAAGDLMRTIMEKNPKRETQAQACLGLAKFEEGRAPDQAEKYYQQLIEKFGDVKTARGTMADVAKQEVAQMKKAGDFAIGKVAPDIAGEDIQGQKFKLSDYRGKVVVIDFWGDW